MEAKTRKSPPKVNIRCFASVRRNENNQSKYQRRLYVIAARGRRIYTAFGPLEIASNGRIYPVYLQQTTFIFSRYDDAMERAQLKIENRLKKGYESITKLGPKPSVKLNAKQLFDYVKADGAKKAATLRRINDFR